MYIKSIILDGFKSYGKRVEVNGFDKEFNAITGLNGTGKSNILDSICFVLGITNLGHVRANSLQDLIFKAGQAGVVKANVTIVFDNRDPENSPPGFEDFEEITITRQVVMGGKNKYLINGTLVTNKKVQDMFCSVQLNVNNPHFLIMQGRVTKVLNMKPPEILAMLEETAGTRMYETKRQAAMKVMSKKDAKLAELNAIFDEEISPKLKKLREEKQAYLDFLRLQTEIEHMSNLYKYWRFHSSKKATLRAEEKLKQCEDQVNNIRNDIKTNLAIIDEITNTISNEVEASGNTKLVELEAAVKAKEKICNQAVAAEKTALGNISNEEKKIKQIEKFSKDEQLELTAKEKEIEKVQNILQKLEETNEKDEAAYELSQKKFQALNAGMEVNDKGESETLIEQLMNVNREKTQAITDAKVASMELANSKEQLREKEKELGNNTAEYKNQKLHFDQVDRAVKTLQNSLTKVNGSAEKLNELQNRRKFLVTEIRNRREFIDNFEARRPHAKFSYHDPVHNFDRRKVHGILWKLFTVKDPKHSTALEIAAGGRLYNVVVDNENTSKMLLQNGQLRTRTTFIPLNKIQAAKMDTNTIKLAQEVGGKDNVYPALSLIEYDQQLKPAMEYIFGNVFVCTDMNVASAVTFHDRIKKKCVTLEGDVTDPGGTFSGGAMDRGTPVLLQMQEVKESERILQDGEKEFAKIEEHMGQMEGLIQSLELKQHELEMVKKSLEQTSHFQQQQEVDGIKENIAQLTESLKKYKEIEESCVKKAKELQMKMDDSSGHIERQLKSAENEMKQLKTKSDKSKKEYMTRKEELNALSLEISDLKKSIESKTQQVENDNAHIAQIKEELVELKNKVAEVTSELNIVQTALDEEKKSVAAKNKEVQKNLQRKEQLIAKNNELELEIKKLNHDIKKCADDHESAKQEENKISKNIDTSDEKSLRGASKMSDKDGEDLYNRIKKAQDKHNNLGRTINAKAQRMFEHEEKQFNSLLKKKGIVESDRNKLIAVMADLDEKKKESIKLAYEQVKKDFGSIFKSLLPGSDATLKPPHGKTILEGLEVKVNLGGVWKESLTELSGGQRSLVALSLILAMLLFKPAPLYILDEVDAALDLSHTQNIGNMLKRHFKQSQFIIVSLKDGMFNNANVLFRTRFIDGVSSVSRTVNHSH